MERLNKIKFGPDEIIDPSYNLNDKDYSYNEEKESSYHTLYKPIYHPNNYEEENDSLRNIGKNNQKHINNNNYNYNKNDNDRRNYDRVEYNNKSNSKTNNNYYEAEKPDKPVIPDISNKIFEIIEQRHSTKRTKVNNNEDDNIKKIDNYDDNYLNENATFSSPKDNYYENNQNSLNNHIHNNHNYDKSKHKQCYYESPSNENYMREHPHRSKINESPKMNIKREEERKNQNSSRNSNSKNSSPTRDKGYFLYSPRRTKREELLKVKNNTYYPFYSGKNIDNDNDIKDNKENKNNHKNNLNIHDEFNNSPKFYNTKNVSKNINKDSSKEILYTLDENNYIKDLAKRERNEDFDIRLEIVLSILDLKEFKFFFEDNKLNFNDLLFLTRDDLVDLKIPLGPRNRLFSFSDTYKKFGINYTIGEIRKFFNENRSFVIHQPSYEYCLNNYNETNHTILKTLADQNQQRLKEKDLEYSEMKHLETIRTLRKIDEENKERQIKQEIIQKEILKKKNDEKLRRVEEQEKLRRLEDNLRELEREKEIFRERDRDREREDRIREVERLTREKDLIELAKEREKELERIERERYREIERERDIERDRERDRERERESERIRLEQRINNKIREKSNLDSPNNQTHNNKINYNNESPSRDNKDNQNKAKNQSPLYNNINPYIYSGRLKRTPTKYNYQVKGEINDYMKRYKSTVDKSQERYNKIRCVLQKCEKYADRNNETYHLHNFAGFTGSKIKKNYSPSLREINIGNELKDFKDYSDDEDKNINLNEEINKIITRVNSASMNSSDIFVAKLNKKKQNNNNNINSNNANDVNNNNNGFSNKNGVISSINTGSSLNIKNNLNQDENKAKSKKSSNDQVNYNT